MNLTIRLGMKKDINEIEQLYNDINDHLASTNNYPGWLKGVYPVRENAESGIEKQCLYVAEYNNRIVGSIILLNEPEQAYLPVQWMQNLDYKEVSVIHTFLVHPEYQGKGIAREMLNFAEAVGREMNIKSLRLDVYENNLPAISLYEKSGFCYIDTVDLGLGNYNLHWFKLYEKLL